MGEKEGFICPVSHLMDAPHKTTTIRDHSSSFLPLLTLPLHHILFPHPSSLPHFLCIIFFSLYIGNVGTDSLWCHRQFHAGTCRVCSGLIVRKAGCIRKHVLWPFPTRWCRMTTWSKALLFTITYTLPTPKCPMWSHRVHFSSLFELLLLQLPAMLAVALCVWAGEKHSQCGRGLMWTNLPVCLCCPVLSKRLPSFLHFY